MKIRDNDCEAVELMNVDRPVGIGGACHDLVLTRRTVMNPINNVDKGWAANTEILSKWLLGVVFTDSKLIDPHRP